MSEKHSYQSDTAGSRNTTPLDFSYPLLGIFIINIVLDYIVLSIFFLMLKTISNTSLNNLYPNILSRRTKLTQQQTRRSTQIKTEGLDFLLYRRIQLGSILMGIVRGIICLLARLKFNNNEINK